MFVWCGELGGWMLSLRSHGSWKTFIRDRLDGWSWSVAFHTDKAWQMTRTQLQCDTTTTSKNNYIN